jgi:PhoH-like ATPase
LKNENEGTDVVLVSKDINLRLKAASLGLQAEDYKSDAIRTKDLSYTGRTTIENVDPEVIRKLYRTGVSRKITTLDPHRQNNHYYHLKSGSSSAMVYFNGQSRVMERVDKSYAFGIKARNSEQAFAMHAVMNPDVSLVTIGGAAGTGKTLLALAAALEQKNRFDQIILARPIVALSNRDLGYLPGDAEEKVNPYMQPLWDNLQLIQSQFGENERKAKLLQEMRRDQKIVISPLAYIRGRSISNAIFIIDEAQNLTPHEVKTIITRAGENCKIVLTGDIRQIDTPYLDEHSNGLSYVINRLKGQDLYAHVTLERGERSPLANLANQFL